MSTPQQPDFQHHSQSGQPQNPYENPYLQSTAPGTPAPAKSQPKRFGWPVLAAAAFLALLLGIGIGAGGSSSSTTASAKPAPTVTVTQPAPAATEGAGAPVDEPTEEPSEDTTVDETYSPEKSDFEIGIKTLSKECFGSAGCNVSFRIKPSYAGTQALPTSGEIEVTYKITGLEDPFQNTFTVDGEGTITYTKEESGSTTSSGAKLKAKVTDVEYTP